ncbi:hypothetical protein JCM6882_005390 [Rhodosporidiobolus microsporus]
MLNPRVQLHPQALRNPQPSSSSASSSSSNNPPSPLATTPFFPSLDSLLPSHAPSPSHSAPSSSSTTSSSTPRAHSRMQHPQQPLDLELAPSHGLVDLDPHAYPLYSLAPHVPEIRILSATQYAQLQDRYSRVKLPEQELFPWAHGGADLPHTAAAQYFGFARGKAAEAPSYRGLTTVYVPPPPPSSRPPSRSLLRRGLASFSSWSSSSSSNATSSSGSSSASPSPPPPSTPTCRLASAFELSQIVSTCPSSGVTSFALPTGDAFHNVNLRHFNLQAAKYASVSDVVVYGENGIDETVVEAAARLREAMDYEWKKRGCAGVRYNVFVVSDPFSAFEREFPHLVAIDAHGFSRNRINFFDREKEEMRVLTQASEIGENVWLGNTQDVPLAKSYARPLSSDSTSSLIDDGNPYSFSICVESHDGAPLCASETLARADGQLNILEAQGQTLTEIRHLLADDSGDSDSFVEAKTTVLRPHVDDIVHLEALSTSTALGSSARLITAYVNQLVDLACWIRDEASPSPLTRGTHLPRRVLLHCADGYTETSLLALTYVMVTRRCPAPEAYLVLQHECQRSFFVYPTDRQTVLKLEQRVKAVLDREDDEEAAALRWHAEQQLAVAQAQAQAAIKGETVDAAAEAARATSSGMERSDSGFVDSTPASPPGDDKSVVVDEAKAAAVALELEETQRAIEDQLERELSRPRVEMRLSSAREDGWFFGPTFEGHFPSRILPYLYLGNLNHASNALMLKELGITHVVSLGESALHHPRAPSTFSTLTAPFRSSPLAAADADAPDNSLWLEERLGNIAVLDMKNVADDGIDSIQPCIDEALEFIEQARQGGGRVLVHCKVGVSRSASIVIAYLMKEWNLDLASAYLLTRSRRLNILIQPNLPFMATLHAFEGALLDSKERFLAQQQQHRRTLSTSSDPNSIYSSDGEGAGAGALGGEDVPQNFGRAGLKRSNRLAFSYLCQQVAKLNERFLCCMHRTPPHRDTPLTPSPA